MNQYHIIEDLESYYCLIIRTTIKKIISTLQLNDCQNIYEVIIGTFMRRKNIYDEGLLAISSFAISKLINYIDIKKSFKIFMTLKDQSFNTYLKHSLGKEMYNNSFILNAGVIALEDVVKALQEDFSYFTAEYIPLLTGILGSDDVKKEIKLPVISLIGEICFRTKENFIPFLEEIMKILFGACIFSLTDSSLDPELEEYFNKLRFSLAETFTLIVYGLEDCKKLDIFSKYVADIFSYFKRLIDLGNQISLDIKKAVLGFIIDLINCYGRDLITILDTSLLSKLILDLKECNNKEYNKYAIQSEEVSFSLNFSLLRYILNENNTEEC